MTLLLYLIISSSVIVALYLLSLWTYSIEADLIDLLLLGLTWPATALIVAGIFVACFLDKIFE